VGPRRGFYRTAAGRGGAAPARRAESRSGDPLTRALSDGVHDPASVRIVNTAPYRAGVRAGDHGEHADCTHARCLRTHARDTCAPARCSAPQRQGISHPPRRAPTEARPGSDVGPRSGPLRGAPSAAPPRRPPRSKGREVDSCRSRVGRTHQNAQHAQHAQQQNKAAQMPKQLRRDPT